MSLIGDETEYNDDAACQEVGNRSQPVPVPTVTPAAILKLYPNPTSNSVKIEWAGLGNDYSVLKIKVVDAMGREVFNHKMLPEANNYLLDTEGYPSGIYTLKVTADDIKIFSEKLVLVK